MEKVTDCLDYLISTDDEYGRLRGAVKGFEHRLKIAKAMAFLDAKGEGSQGERAEIAIASQSYKDLVEEYENTVAEMETIAAKRKSRELTIEVWRSQSANKRTGNI